MEKRRLLVIGVEGSDVEGWIPDSQGRGTIVFGLPFRHEDDAERALRFAFHELQENRRMVVKEIELDVKEMKPSISWESCFGRDLSLLEPGDVLVAPEIAQIYDRLFLFEHVEEEGRDLYFLRGARRRPTRLHGLSPVHAPLIGRKLELQRLDELLDQVRLDQGQICGIVGSPGIGKTRLILAFKKILSRRNIRWVEAASTTKAMDSLESFREIVRRLVGHHFEYLDRFSLTEVEQDYLRLLLSPLDENPRLKDLDDQQLQQGMYYSIRKLLHAAATSPLVIFLEDIHHYDKEGVSILEYLMEGIESTNLLLILSHRFELSGGWTQRLNYNEFQLSPFSETELIDFLRALLKVDRVPEKVFRRLFNLSLGNPLFIEEFVRQLIHAGQISIETSDDGGRILRIKDEDLHQFPTTLHSLIASRFDQANDRARTILRCGALLGQPFLFEELRGFLVEKFGQDAKDEILALIEQGYLQEVSVFPNRLYRFTHDLVYEVVRASFSDKDRRQENARVARFLRKRYAENVGSAVYRIADYYLDSDDEYEAIQESLEAGDYAYRIHQYPKASFFHREALRRWEGGKRTVLSPEEIYPIVIRSMLAVGSTDRARDALRKWGQGKALESNKARGIHAFLEMKYHQLRSEFSDVLTSSDNVKKHLGKDDLSANEWKDLHRDRIQALLWTGNPKKAWKECNLSLKKYFPDQQSAEALSLRSLRILCLVVWGDRFPEEDLKTVVDALEEFDIREQGSWTPRLCLETGFRTIRILGRQGFMNQARALSERMISIADECGLQQEVARGNVFLGRAELDLGLFSKSLSTYEQALELSYEVKDRVIQLQCLSGIADTLLQLGVVDEAESLHPEVSNPAFRQLDPWQKAYQFFLQGYAKELKAQWAKAAEEYERAASLYADAGDKVLSEVSQMRDLVVQSRGKIHPAKTIKKKLEKLAAKSTQYDVPLWREERMIAWHYLGSNDPAVHLDKVWSSTEKTIAKTAHNEFRMLVARLAFANARNHKVMRETARSDIEALLEKWERSVPTKYLQPFREHPLLSM